MTTRKDLKSIIRSRMEKTGESYSTARRQILEQAGRVCPSCKGELLTRTVREMPELLDDDDVTEGQLADYMAAMESGDYGEWAHEVEEVYCPRCESPIGRALKEHARVDRPRRRR